METLLANSGASVRRETLDGREYLVAPLTLIVPGVLPGSRGPLFYPPEEVQKSVNDWNGMPLTLGHPTANGVNVSGRSPSVQRQFGLGTVYAANYNGKLRAEGWFDVQQTRSKAPDVLRSLQSGKPIELSTGLFTENVPALNGAHHQGRGYTHVARGYRPDHVAVLVGQTGACSLRDGCGVLVNRLTRHFAGTVPTTNGTTCGTKKGRKKMGKTVYNAGKNQPRDKNGRWIESSNHAAALTKSIGGYNPDSDRAAAAASKGLREDAARYHEAAAKQHEGRAKSQIAFSTFDRGPTDFDTLGKHHEAAKAHRDAAAAALKGFKKRPTTNYLVPTGNCKATGKPGPCKGWKVAKQAEAAKSSVPTGPMGPNRPTIKGGMPKDLKKGVLQDPAKLGPKERLAMAVKQASISPPTPPGQKTPSIKGGAPKDLKKGLIYSAKGDRATLKGVGIKVTPANKPQVTTGDRTTAKVIPGIKASSAIGGGLIKQKKFSKGQHTYK